MLDEKLGQTELL